jgi:hypothetical protein
LTQIPISDTAPRMGRPPIMKDSETKPVLVRFPEETLERVDLVAGKNKRAQFIRQAVEAELARLAGSNT